MKFYQIRVFQIFRILLTSLFRLLHLGKSSIDNHNRGAQKSAIKLITHEADVAIKNMKMYLLRYRHPPNKPHPLSIIHSVIIQKL